MGQGRQDPWTHRETRNYLLNGDPAPPPQTPYPNLPYWSRYLNHVLLPSLIRPERFKEYFGYTEQQLYHLRDRYVVPALAHLNMRPYLATADSVTVLFLMKLRKDIDFLSLHLFFGDLGDGTVERWFHCVLDYIYSQGNLLQDLRRLSQNQPMTRILDALHAATAANSRCCAMFIPMMQRFQAQNPLLPQHRLVVVDWDSRHIPIPHTSCFSHQQRLFSTKIHGNAVVKLVG